MPHKQIPHEIKKALGFGDTDYLYEFSSRISMPEGYHIIWCDGVEHYLAIGPNENGPYEWESAITWDKWQARRFAINHYNHNKNNLKEK